MNLGQLTPDQDHRISGCHPPTHLHKHLPSDPDT